MTRFYFLWPRGMNLSNVQTDSCELGQIGGSFEKNVGDKNLIRFYILGDIRFFFEIKT